MSLETKSPERNTDSPRDKPAFDRVEHANLDRPGAQSHPRAMGWHRPADAASAWRRH